MPPALKASLLGFTEVAENTLQMRLKVPDDFSFTAGQYVSLTIPSLADLPGTEGFHDFSISSSPKETGIIKITFRKSQSIFKQTLVGQSAGSELVLEGPSGIFTLPKDQPIIAVAGGIGITPFMSMLEGGQTSFELMYYNRTPKTAVYLEELSKLLGPKLHSFFGDIDLTQLKEMYLKNPNLIWYIAGPPAMVSKTRTLLKTLMLDDKMVRTEEFSGYGKHNQ